MIDPALHAAFVVLAAFVIKFIFQAIGLNVDDVVLNTFAAAVVTYILSLLGYNLVKQVTNKGVLPEENKYKPPFT